MNNETLRDYCLSLHGAEEATPFGPDVLVYKVKGKIFLLLPLDTGDCRFNVKCDPDKAPELREQYPCLVPGHSADRSEIDRYFACRGDDQRIYSAIGKQCLDDLRRQAKLPLHALLGDRRKAELRVNLLFPARVYGICAAHGLIVAGEWGLLDHRGIKLAELNLEFSEG